MTTDPIDDARRWLDKASETPHMVTLPREILVRLIAALEERRRDGKPSTVPMPNIYADCDRRAEQIAREVMRTDRLAMTIRNTDGTDSTVYSQVAGYDPARDYLRNATGAMNPAAAHPCSHGSLQEFCGDLID